MGIINRLRLLAIRLARAENAYAKYNMSYGMDETIINTIRLAYLEEKLKILEEGDVDREEQCRLRNQIAGIKSI